VFPPFDHPNLRSVGRDDKPADLDCEASAIERSPRQAVAEAEPMAAIFDKGLLLRFAAGAGGIRMAGHQQRPRKAPAIAA
jgi:hypothetical protein